MRICILISSNDAFELNPDMEPEPYLDMLGHTYDKVVVQKRTAVAQIVTLAKNGYDIFLNLCDGAWDEDRAGSEVISTLERLNLPYTGGSPDFYDPTRQDMKITALYYGVNTPEYKMCWNAADVEAAAATLTFPLIAKHYNSYNSIGMTKDSKCMNAEALAAEAGRFVSTYGGSLVEEFIDGNEYTVLVAENPADDTDPIVYPPVKCSMPPGEDFKHFDLKWKDYDDLAWHISTDEVLNSKLVEMAKTMFVALRGAGYGRLDIRVDNRTGTPYFLEINPQCSIFYPKGAFGSADTILSFASKLVSDGSDENCEFLSFMRNLIDAGLKRWEKKQVAFEVRYNGKSKGFGLFAKKNLKIGDIVERNEEMPTYLVSKEHVDKTWDEKKKLWFRQYCWPMNDSIFAMWKPEPSEWHPINHSCDPNLWLTGLDMTARRAILVGEELTIDYATFCVGLEPFQCMCGASRCRGLIKGNDYLEPELEDLYGDHVSGFVLMERRKFLANAAVVDSASDTSSVIMDAHLTHVKSAQLDGK
jgi:D-alanine-D-alanine ligase-like ATP-grasp enzyme